MEMGAAAGSFKYSDAVEVQLAPSRTAAVGIAVAGLATLVLLVRLPLGGVWISMVAVGVVALVADSLRTVAARRGARGIAWVRLDRWGAIAVRSAAGVQREGSVRPRSFVAPWLVIVRWRPEGARFDRTFVVLPDMADAESLRRLRVLMKWGEAGIIAA